MKLTLYEFIWVRDIIPYGLKNCIAGPLYNSRLLNLGVKTEKAKSIEYKEGAIGFPYTLL